MPFLGFLRRFLSPGHEPIGREQHPAPIKLRFGDKDSSIFTFLTDRGLLSLVAEHSADLKTGRPFLLVRLHNSMSISKTLSSALLSGAQAQFPDEEIQQIASSISLSLTSSGKDHVIIKLGPPVTMSEDHRREVLDSYRGFMEGLGWSLSYDLGARRMKQERIPGTVNQLADRSRATSIEVQTNALRAAMAMSGTFEWETVLVESDGLNYVARQQYLFPEGLHPESRTSQ